MLKVGDSYSKRVVATDEIVGEIARVSGDINPVHLDEDYAQKSIFGRRIAHGLFCLNAISMILGNHLPGEGTILLSQSFQYMRPVYIDDVIEVTLTVNEVYEEKSIYVIGAVCKKEDGTVVLEGSSKVKWVNHNAKN